MEDKKIKIRFMSDIHLEFANMRVKGTSDADVIVLAGDIGPGMSGWRWAEKTFPDTPVLYVAGNHEFYSSKYSIHQLYAKMRSQEGSNVTLLQNSHVIIGDVIFVGGTWWTDFLLNGNAIMDKLRAPDVMNDYEWVDYKMINVRATPDDIQAENFETTNYIRDVIESNPGKKIVVVTHHAPCNLSSHHSYKDSSDNVYFANTIDRMYDFPLPTLWIHGHMHNSIDYMMGDCRVLANPRGYYNYGSGDNQKFFNPNAIVEI